MLNLWSRAGAILLILGTVASAQQSRHSLQSQNDAFITANGRNAITGPIVNSMFNGVITSAGMLSDANTWTGPNTFSGSVIFPDPASVRANLGLGALAILNTLDLATLATGTLSQSHGGTGAASVPIALGNLLSCTPGSSVAPVATGQAFQCAGVILIAQ